MLLENGGRCSFNLAVPPRGFEEMGEVGPSLRQVRCLDSWEED